MTTRDAAVHLRHWLASEPHSPFAWPLDNDYDQHVRFVCYRNTYWHGGNLQAWRQFCLDYADHLEQESPDALNHG